MFTVTEFNLSDDFQTCTVTLSDKRVIEVPTSELTPEGQEVDSEGDFLEQDGMNPDGFVCVDFAEYFDGIADQPETIKKIIERAGIDSGQTWTVTGRKAGYQKTYNNYPVKAANHTDLLYLIKNFTEVVTIVRDLDKVLSNQRTSAA